MENKTAPRKATMKPVRLPEFFDCTAKESDEEMKGNVTGYLLAITGNVFIIHSH